MATITTTDPELMAAAIRHANSIGAEGTYRGRVIEAYIVQNGGSR